jgi:hypothetical protein
MPNRSRRNFAAAAAAVLAESRDLMTAIGECGDEYRQKPTGNYRYSL